jgi:hypothetical protein
VLELPLLPEPPPLLLLLPHAPAVTASAPTATIAANLPDTACTTTSSWW